MEDDRLELALKLVEKAKKQRGENYYFPEDSVVADQFSNEAAIDSTASDNIPDGWMGLDVGENAIKKFSDAILSSKTILWNGPMGVFEMSNFAKGTKDDCRKLLLRPQAKEHFHSLEEATQ